MRIGECNRSIECHFTDTLQASFANCGLNTEAELILANHVNVFDCIDQSIKIDTHNFSGNYCYRCYQKSIDFNRLPRSGICRSDCCLAKEIKVHFTGKRYITRDIFKTCSRIQRCFISGSFGKGRKERWVSSCSYTRASLSYWEYREIPKKGAISHFISPCPQI